MQRRVRLQGAVTTITAPKPTTDMVACFAIFYGAQPCMHWGVLPDVLVNMPRALQNAGSHLSPLTDYISADKFCLG